MRSHYTYMLYMYEHFPIFLVLFFYLANSPSVICSLTVESDETSQNENDKKMNTHVQE